jgi:hypothetical protein
VIGLSKQDGSIGGYRGEPTARFNFDGSIEAAANEPSPTMKLRRACFIAITPSESS